MCNIQQKITKNTKKEQCQEIRQSKELDPEMIQILEWSNKNVKIVGINILKDLVGKVDNMLKKMGNFNIEIKTIKKSNRYITGEGCDIEIEKNLFGRSRKEKIKKRKGSLSLKVAY